MNRRACLAVLGGLAVAALGGGCAAPLRVSPDTVVPEKSEAFSIEGRFSLRLVRPDTEPYNVAGRLTWQHAANGDQLMLSNPLGQGVAEIIGQPGAASLRDQQGQLWQASTMSELVQRATGMALPLERLADWLRGRTTAQGRLVRDEAGRVVLLEELPWSVRYTYPHGDEGVTVWHPASLVIQRGADGEFREFEMKLRIEEWQTP